MSPRTTRASAGVDAERLVRRRGNSLGARRRRRRRHRARRARARAAKENERPRGVDATNETHESSIDGSSHTKTPSSGFSWRALGDALDAADAADARETRETRGTETKDASFVSRRRRAPARRRRRDRRALGEPSVPRARRRARGRPRDERARGRRGARGASLRGGDARREGGGGVAATAHGGVGGGRRAARDARRRARGRGARARRPCRTCRPTRSGRHSRAPGRRRRAWTPPGGWRARRSTRTRARARRFAPPPPRRAASSRRSETRSRRFCSAPRGFSRRPREARRPSWSSGRPRASYRRARALRAIADAALASPAPERRARGVSGACRVRLPGRAARARRRRADLGERRRAGALWTRRAFFCAAAQPHLGALHRWVDSGELEDPAGELFVRLGSAAAEPPGTEAHWHAGFQIRRGRLGAPECPEFLGRFAEELLEAGKTAGLLRARAPVARTQGERGETETGRDRRRLDGAPAVARTPRRSVLPPRARRARGRFRRRPSALPLPGGNCPVAAASAATAPSLVAPLAPLARAVRVDGERQPSATRVTARSREPKSLRFSRKPPRRRVCMPSRARTPRRRRPFLPAAALDAWLRDDPAARAPATGAVRGGGGRRRGGARTGSIPPPLARAHGASARRVGLGAHLAALRATYLGGAGEAASSLARVAHARLDAAEAAAEADPGSARAFVEEALDRAELESALAEAIKADASGTLPDPETVSLEVLPFHEDASVKDEVKDAEGKDAAPSSLDALARVRVRVEAPWPLALVVPARSAEGYGAAGAFLAQLRRARAATESHATRAWTASARRRPGGGGRAGGARRRQAPRRRDAALRLGAPRARLVARPGDELGRIPKRAGARGDAGGGARGARRVSRRRPPSVPGVAGPHVDASRAAGPRGAGGAQDLAAAGRRADRARGAVGEAFSERESGAVREAEAERVASRFRRARSRHRAGPWTAS